MTAAARLLLVSIPIDLGWSVTVPVDGWMNAVQDKIDRRADAPNRSWWPLAALTPL